MFLSMNYNNDGAKDPDVQNKTRRDFRIMNS